MNHADIILSKILLTLDSKPQFDTTGIKDNVIPVNTKEDKEELEEVSDDETFKELNEGTFNEIDEFASSLPSDSEVSKYHDALQQRLGENSKNKESPS
ncbi:hypothetical protein INT47_012358 [Mucor saturninus]|uniref:Uncharacterized protein n=1 Tax=Mucor saturninus TaxID=64648 RepID=A0A8H7V060_9FUNG|nr:hypothetical protein INT47_012358 [Mucor saturninus]